jgi:hypothetical protein
MEACATDREPRWTALRILVVGAGVGAIAGMMMAAVEMLYGWASDAHTLWDAPMAIRAGVAGLTTSVSPATTSD